MPINSIWEVAKERETLGERLFTPQAAAEILQVSTQTVAVWRKAGRLPGRQVGRRFLYAESDLRAILAASK